jgi:hypothetical protein
MGMLFALEDEFGKKLEKIGDPHRLFLKLMIESDVSQTCCLRFIDPYGATTFNRSQAKLLIDELEILRQKVKKSDQEDLLSEIEKFADYCIENPHHYVKIYGD